jgi:hypothetical protein
MPELMTVTPAQARLRATIAELEAKQTDERSVFRSQVKATFDSIRPINLIKTTLNEVASSQSLKDHLISTGVGLVAGHLSEKIFEGGRPSATRKLLGTAIMFGVTNIVARHPEVVVQVGGKLALLIKKIIAATANSKKP